MRCLAIFENSVYSFADSQKLKGLLRSKGLQVNDVRVGKYVEVDYVSNLFEGEKIGQLLKLNKVEECELEKCNHDLEYLVKNARCWEAHELLEDLWHRADGNEKEDIHRIIKVCVAAVHYQRGNADTAKRILGEALEKGINAELVKMLGIGFLLQKIGEDNETVLKNIALAIWA
ncbi:MAG: DUF309 domain-containing protein [Nitrososphaeria archaeon]|jgi:uncharacterized protein HemY